MEGTRELVLSEHALRRCQQRGVREEDLRVALRAKPVHDRGDLVYRVTDLLLLQLGLARQADRLRGLVVVVTREGVVRTVKWNFELRRGLCAETPETSEPGECTRWSSVRFWTPGGVVVVARKTIREVMTGDGGAGTR